MKRYLLFFVLIFNTLAFAQLPAESSMLVGKGLLSFYTNKSLEVENKDVEVAIISIHGSTRNADTYFKSIWSLSKSFQVEDRTIVIAPHFKISGDTVVRNEYKFSYEGWWIGDQSIGGQDTSSFMVMDYLITKIGNTNLFPKLKEIILTGHSAGGHFVQRYALGTKIDQKYSHLKFKYIVANPGTYAYLTKKRPVAGQAGIYEVPKVARCAYNNYKYGLEKLNPYMKMDSIPNMISRYIKRDIIYFVGESDTGDVEQTCEAQYQGPHRFGRGVNFKGHVDDEYPQNVHELVTVPNVGHTQYGMYTSGFGKKILFNR